MTFAEFTAALAADRDGGGSSAANIPTVAATYLEDDAFGRRRFRDAGARRGPLAAALRGLDWSFCEPGCGQGAASPLERLTLYIGPVRRRRASGCRSTVAVAQY